MSHHAMHNPPGGFYSPTPTDSVAHEYDGPEAFTCAWCSERLLGEPVKDVEGEGFRYCGPECRDEHARYMENV